MVYYKFTNVPMVPVVQAFRSPEDMEPISGMALSDDYILTACDMFEMNDQMWIYDEDREVYYPAYGNSGPNFAKEFAYSAIVSEECAAGLDIYNGATEDAEKIFELAP